MPEDISTQILSQASDNIQKLFDLSTRIDERVKVIQERQERLERDMQSFNQTQGTVLQKLAVLDHKGEGDKNHERKIDDLQVAVNQIERKIDKLEGEQGNSNDRWNKIAGFVIQLVWVILAAYMLTKLNLQAPAVP
jgi:chromosome segregation ATPase